jgi:hypothetical protein
MKTLIEGFDSPMKNWFFIFKFSDFPNEKSPINLLQIMKRLCFPNEKRFCVIKKEYFDFRNKSVFFTRFKSVPPVFAPVIGSLKTQNHLFKP